NPGYPTYQAVTNMIGATPVFYELTEEGGWLPDLEKLEEQDLTRVKLMWVNYPHMPTGAAATKKVFEDLVKFGKKHDILIVNDNPYSFILNKNPKSILKTAGAMDGVLELNSLSKSFNMSGWRIGMVCGSEHNLNFILKVKTNMDSGMFFPLQAGAVQALALSQTWFAKQDEIYERRKKRILELARLLGCEPSAGRTGMFVWTKVPGETTSVQFVDNLRHQHRIFAAPGFIFGSKGEGYVRFSLCATEENINRAIQRLK